jgi:hypothetical protein
MRRKKMDDRRTEASPRLREAAAEPRARVFLRAGDAPLPDGVEEGDESLLIRLVAPTPAEMEAANVAY